jgi:hypothetical protein
MIIGQKLKKALPWSSVIYVYRSRTKAAMEAIVSAVISGAA